MKIFAKLEIDILGPLQMICTAAVLLLIAKLYCLLTRILSSSGCNLASKGDLHTEFSP